MNRLLFEDFLKNIDQYYACETFWLKVIAEVEQSLAQTGEWVSWIPRAYAGGAPFELDGNPIIDGRSKNIDRSFRIIQHASTDGNVEISAWLKHYEEEFTDLPRNELIINLILSEGSLELARDLLRKWMFDSTTIEEMQAFIDQNFPRQFNPDSADL